MINTRTFDVPISVLFSQKKQYNNYPKFQRGKVWPETMRKMLIDSLIRGYPIGEILAYFDEDPQAYQIIDGQQRLSTIFAFLEGDFSTITDSQLSAIEPQPIACIEPGKRWQQLTVTTRRKIENYTLHFMQVDKVSETELGIMFRRLQMDAPLTMGEKLASYSSYAKDRALDLAHHHFFNGVYTGDKRHQQIFHMCLYLIEITRVGFPVELKKPTLSQLTSGKYDAMITQELLDIVQQRLDVMANLFAGAQMKAKTDIIGMYQAIIKLERAGYDLHASKVGCLVDWFRKAKHAPLVGAHSWGNLNTFAQLSHKRIQETLWDRQERELLLQPGLVLLGQRRLDSISS